MMPFTKKWKSEYQHPEGWIFQIWHEIGIDKGHQNREVDLFFFYVTTKDNELLRDHCQDTLEIAQEQALDEWGVPVDSWVEVPL